MVRKNELTYKYKIKTYEERIKLLENMGIIQYKYENLTPDTHVLKYYPYEVLIDDSKMSHRFSGGIFHNEDTLEHLIKFYMFRSTFESMIMRYILYIERALKESISYIISIKYGHFTDKKSESLEIPNDYLNKNNYSQSNPSVNGILRKLKRIVVNPPFYANAIHKFHKKSNIPSFIVLQNLMFKNTIDWYYILKKEDKKEIIGNIFGIDFQEQENKYFVFFINCLRLLNELRNKCAHNGAEIEFDKNNYKGIPYDIFLLFYNETILSKNLYNKEFKESPESLALLAIYVFLDFESRNQFLIDFFQLFNENIMRSYGLSVDEALDSLRIKTVYILFESLVYETLEDEDISKY